MEKLTKARIATLYEMTSHKLVWKKFTEENEYNLYATSGVSVRKDNRHSFRITALPVNLKQ